MSLYSVAIISTLLLVVVVSAAPNQVFDLGEILSKGNDSVDVVKCIGNAVSDVVEKNNVKGVLEDSLKELEQLGEVEWKKCVEIEDANDQKECKVAVVKKAYTILSNLYSKLFDENQIDLLLQIRNEVVNRCFSN